MPRFLDQIHLQGNTSMKNPVDVLRIKEQEILKIKVEIEALRITARLLSDDGPADAIPTQHDLRQLIEMP